MSSNELPIVLLPGKGRSYACGPMTAIFKADGAETVDRYSASEWVVAPHSPGSGPHSHENNEELFLVTEGVMLIRVGDAWVNAPRGTFIRVPAGVIHDFENRTSQPAALFNVFLPGGFESMMAEIVSWFAENEAKKKTAPQDA